MEEVGQEIDDVLLAETDKDQILLLTYEVDEVGNIDDAEKDSEKELEDPFGLIISFLKEDEDDEEDVQFPVPITSPTLPRTSLSTTIVSPIPRSHFPTTSPIPTPTTISPIPTTISSIPTVSPTTTHIPQTTQILPPPMILPSSTAPTSAYLQAWDPDYVPSTWHNWTTSTSMTAVTIQETTWGTRGRANVLAEERFQRRQFFHPFVDENYKRKFVSKKKIIDMKHLWNISHWPKDKMVCFKNMIWRYIQEEEKVWSDFPIRRTVNVETDCSRDSSMCYLMLKEKTT